MLNPCFGEVTAAEVKAFVEAGGIDFVTSWLETSLASLRKPGEPQVMLEMLEWLDDATLTFEQLSRQKSRLPKLVQQARRCRFARDVASKVLTTWVHMFEQHRKRDQDFIKEHQLQQARPHTGGVAETISAASSPPAADTLGGASPATEQFQSQAVEQERVLSSAQQRSADTEQEPPDKPSIDLTAERDAESQKNEIDVSEVVRELQRISGLL